MVNTTISGTAESPYLRGQLKMVASQIMRWYPSLAEMDIRLVLDPQNQFQISANLKFSDAVSMIKGLGKSAEEAIDDFMVQINPHLNPLPGANRLATSG